MTEPKLSHGGYLPERTPQRLPDPDPRAEDWAGKNRWFGQDRAMTFTAFEIHKDLVEKEGFDPKSNEYYVEIDKRIRVDFPHINLIEVEIEKRPNPFRRLLLRQEALNQDAKL